MLATSPGSLNSTSVAGAMRSAVVAFRAATSARSLVAEAPEIIARIGFDRVLISRVDDGVWMPESMFVRTDARWAEAIVEAGRSETTLLGTVVETDVVTSGRVFAVDEVQTHPRVCRPIAKVSKSDNYGVAPLTIGSAVVGMVHVDCYFQQRRVRQEQCEQVAVVAESLAAHLSRLLLLEQLQVVREAAGRHWPDGTGVRGQLAPVETHPVAADLTGRELDVMRLMATGETNSGIARRLAISPGTVKTHVSNILHKYGAANRAQAVSVWGRR